MRRFALIVGLVAIPLVLATIVVVGVPIRWPSQDSIRSVVLPTHTGLGIRSTDSFLGVPGHDGDCFYYTDTDGVRMLPVWPPGYSGKLGVMFLGVHRPRILPTTRST